MENNSIPQDIIKIQKNWLCLKRFKKLQKIYKKYWQNISNLIQWKKELFSYKTIEIIEKIEEETKRASRIKILHFVIFLIVYKKLARIPT